MTTERRKLLSRWADLEQERGSWVAHWREISDNLLPRSGRFSVEDRNRGDKRHNAIRDSTGPRALRTLAAGLMAGMTSPARPWFRLTTSDPALDEAAAVKTWLADVTRIMQMVFAKSNTNRALHTCYSELGAFGTAASIVLPDYQGVIRHYPVTAGAYALASDYTGRVNTFYREFQVPVAQLVGEFGKDRCSGAVRHAYDNGRLDHWITVMHVIEPRSDRDPSKRDSINMPWRSCYFERATDEDKVLRESGFREFSALCPRWELTGEDIYGHSPAMEALGDLKQLQHEQLRKAQAIDNKTNPPLQVPSSMRAHDLDLLPGGISYVDAASPGGGVRSAYDAQIDLSHLLDDIRDVRERINATFYSDLFLMLYQADDRRMTATEVAERHEEKLLMLGPVLERMHNELLDPLINITFTRMVEANIVPPPPEELQGRELSVEFVSMLAQAQRAVATNSIDRFVGNLGAVAQFKPDVLDKFDADKWADAYADMLGVDPDLIVPGAQVALVRQQRAQAQQAAQETAMLEQGASAVAKLASAKTDGANLLTDATRAFSGYT